MPRRDELAFIHLGAFSGSAGSLRRALGRTVETIDIDLIRFARKPSLLRARLSALREARLGGDGIPWTRTETWSAATQRALTRAGVLTRRRPILFIQSLPAIVLNSDIRYGVYTDRVGREGAAAGKRHASRFTDGWLKREEAFLRGAQRVYVMGSTTKEVLIHHYGVPTSRIKVVGAGPNVPLGPPASSRSCRRLLFVGTQWELKGGPELLSAFVRVRKTFPGLELILAGSRPRHRLPRGVRSVGRVLGSQMDDLYSQADALVIPTHMEAFGIALLEGLIKGLPCIATNVGNQPWIIGDAGECVEAGDTEALVRSIGGLVANYPDYRRRAHSRGRELRDQFRWEPVAATILADLLGSATPTESPESCSSGIDYA